MLADVICHCKMTTVMTLEVQCVMLCLCLKDITNTSERVRHSPTIGGNFSVQWWKIGRSLSLQMCFRRLLCVRIKIDQL